MLNIKDFEFAKILTLESILGLVGIIKITVQCFFFEGA